MSTSNKIMTLYDTAELMKIDEMETDNMIPLLTIGYEGYSIEDFVNQLKAYNVGYLFDVREIPFSRKKGFSKAPLQETMKKHNINYHHFKELGSPKIIRNKLHEDKDYDSFFYEYEQYLETQTEAMEIVSTAIAENKDTRFCLLCFEKNSELCHRNILAQKISDIIENEVEIVNI
jgi:uncharacterized protein (DUF488 family)